MKETILGYSVETCSAEECVQQILQHLESNPSRCKWLACFNPHSYAVARNDEAFRLALMSADWLIPDGIGAVLASKLLQGAIQRRITGSDIFWGVLGRANRSRPIRVFLLGSTEETLLKCVSRITAEYPAVVVAGTYSPPYSDVFSPAELVAMREAINAAHSDVLWVAMTAPKQEKWILQNCDYLNVKFAAAVGAVFDFFAGTAPRAPNWIQRLGLEWFHRFLLHPRRMWRRTFHSAPKFVSDVAWAWATDWRRKKN